MGFGVTGGDVQVGQLGTTTLAILSSVSSANICKP
jgi:hypothetical protein